MPLTKSGLRGDPVAGLSPVPMGVFEGPEGAGLMDLIKKLISPEEVADKVRTISPEYAKNLLNDMTSWLKSQNLATEPGMNIFPADWGGGKAKNLVYTGPKGEIIGTAIVEEIPGSQGKFYTSNFAVDKAKGLLAGKAAAAIGKKLGEMGAANIRTSISHDTYKILQHLAKLAK